MKKFFGEFKKFITRGNVVDMAVGVTVGSAFTAIVTALSNNILKPIINWVLMLITGENSLSEIFTYLKKVTVQTQMIDASGSPVFDALGNPVMIDTAEVDLVNSIYIDWGAFINAIINFLLIAFVLFVIVKVINGVKDKQASLTSLVANGKVTKAEKADMKAKGLNYKDVAVVEDYRAAIAKEAEEKAAAEKAAADEKAAKEAFAAAAPERQEALLREICELLKNK